MLTTHLCLLPCVDLFNHKVALLPEGTVLEREEEEDDCRVIEERLQDRDTEIVSKRQAVIRRE